MRLSIHKQLTKVA